MAGRLGGDDMRVLQIQGLDQSAYFDSLALGLTRSLEQQKALVRQHALKR